MNILDWLSDSQGYMPHGHCYLWQPAVLWLNVGADALIAASYFTIPVVLYSFVRSRRHELPYWWVPLLFSAFIFLCGTTHLISIWTTWNPDYRIDGVVKFATGVVSAATAVALLFVMPKVMRLQTPAALEREVGARTAELAGANARLREAVAERAVAARALERSEERFRLATRALRGSIYDLDLATGVAERSAGLSDMLGYEAADMPADLAWWIDQVHPDDRAAFEAERDGAAAQGREHAQLEYRVRRRDGGYVWVADHAILVRDATGRVVRMVGSVIDVSTRKRAEAALGEAAERLRERVEELETVIRLAPVGIAVARDRECRNVTGNAALNAMLGVTAERNVSSTAPKGERLPYELHAGGVAVPADEMPLQQAARDGIVTTGREFGLHLPPDREICVILNAAPLVDATGRPRGGVATLQDITRQKAVEAKLRETDRRKDEFLATLSHELRNPLAPLRNAVELLARPDAPPGSGDTARAMIERQLAHLVRLVDDLLDVSRIATGKIRLRRSRVALALVLQQAVETARPHLDEHGHALEITHVDPDLWLDADPVRLAQVFVNLLNNAARYTASGGRVAVKLAAEGPVVRASVTDNGRGLEPEELERIFELFSQADPSESAARGGLGIGLTLARRLVEMHGGTLVAESAGLGCGSTFTVELPLAAGKPDVAAERDAGRTGGTRRLRLVVADDNRDAADSLAMLLALGGHEVHTVYDGPAAIEAIERLAPDAALIDIGMPGLDGYQVAARVRTGPLARSVRLAALTGWGQHADQRAARAAGFDRHFTKPAEPDEIAGWLEGPQ